MKYRKKPVVIEAKQFDGSMRSAARLSTWMDAFAADYAISPHADGTADFWVVTLEGTMEVSAADFLIQGVQGEFYPCKPDIFEATYELAED